jgi:hypothetical protein
MVKNEVNFSDDKMNGYYKEYSPNGSLSNTTKYINGVLQTNVPELAKLDVKTTYFETGTVKFTGTYKDGVAEGIHREFSPEGRVIAAKVYVDGYLTGEGILDTAGRQQGPWKEYHPNGELKSQGEYLNGKRIGDWVFYHPNKKIEQNPHGTMGAGRSRPICGTSRRRWAWMGCPVTALSGSCRS